MAAPDQPAEPGTLPGTVADRARVGLAGEQPLDSHEAQAAAEATPPPGEDLGSLVGDLRVLAGDAQTLVEAELAYQSARVAYVWSRGRRVALWGAVALACGFFAMVALVVGLLLALVPLIGVWGALAAVALALLLGAALAARIATSEIRRILGQVIASDPLVPPKGVAAPEPMGPPTPPELAT